MRAILSLCLPLAALLSAPHTASSAQAQETKPFVADEIAILRSKILVEDRPLFIDTHSSYDEDESRYPVAYVLDGEGNFYNTSGVIDLLLKKKRTEDIF